MKVSKVRFPRHGRYLRTDCRRRVRLNGGESHDCRSRSVDQKDNILSDETAPMPVTERRVGKVQYHLTRGIKCEIRRGIARQGSETTRPSSITAALAPKQSELTWAWAVQGCG